MCQHGWAGARARCRASERDRCALALGATRLRLLRQFMTESVLLAALGGVAGILFALAGTHSLLTLFPNDVANLNIPKVTAIPVDQGVLCFALFITLLTAFLFGIAPVLKAARAEASGAMKESVRGTMATRRANRLRSVMVVSEIVLSLILLTAAGLVVASLQHVLNADLGFEPNHVLSLQVFLPPDRYPRDDREKRRALVAEVVRKMDALPGVKAAAATNYLPLSGFWGTTSFLLRGQAQPKPGELRKRTIACLRRDICAPWAFHCFSGRDFTAADRLGGAQVAMINQTMAKQYFKGRDPIGEEINLTPRTNPTGGKLWA